jgi:hypothetical protein
MVKFITRINIINLYNSYIMEYLDKNYVVFTTNSKTKDIYFLGKIKNTTLDLLIL